MSRMKPRMRFCSSARCSADRLAFSAASISDIFWSRARNFWMYSGRRQDSVSTSNRRSCVAICSRGAFARTSARISPWRIRRSASISSEKSGAVR